VKKISDSVYQQLAEVYREEDGVYCDGFPAEALRIIREHRLFKLFLPELLGGAGCTLIETLEVIQRCAFINGSLGWLVQIGNGGNFFAAFINEKTARELFSPADAVLAGSGALTGTATPAQGGYVVSGRWKYASGSTYASFFTFSAKVAGSEEHILGVLMPEQVNVIEDWKTTGMRFTSTNTFTATDQFVPLERVFGLTERQWLNDIPVFRFPFFPFAQSFFLSIQYGLLKRICAEAITMAHANAGRWANQYPARATAILAGAAQAQQQLKTFEQELISLVHVVEQARTIQEPLLEEFDSCAKRQSSEIMRTAYAVFALLGMDVLFETHPANIAYRDMIVCAQHSLLNNYRTIL
jgi:alkylation response protein AidB-like acyl-CoA dehydrogenase